MSDGKELKENELTSGQDNEQKAVAADTQPSSLNEKDQSGIDNVDADKGQNGGDASRDGGETQPEVNKEVSMSGEKGTSEREMESESPDTEQVSVGDAGESGQTEKNSEEEGASDKSPSGEGTLAGMKLVEVDAAEGIRHAKQTLNELEALLDDFENSTQASGQEAASGAGGAERNTLAEFDKRLEEVTSTVTAAAAANRAAKAAPPADTKKAGGSVVLLGILTVVALLLSVISFLQVRGVNERLDAMEQSSGLPGSGGRSEEIARLHMQFQQLSSKVNELSMRNARESGKSGSDNGVSLKALDARLSQLEQQLGTATAEMGETTTASTETEQESSEPVAQEEPPHGGRWVINLTSFSSEEVADSEIKRLHELGIDVEKHSVVSNGKVWYRLRITGLATYESAKAYIESLKHKIDIGTAWINNE